MAIILDEGGTPLLDEGGAFILDEAGIPPGKTSGLGDDLFAGGFHVGGDIRDLSVSGGVELRDVTLITQSAHARLGGLRDGGMQVTSYHDPAAGRAHAAFSALPRTDVILTYCRGQLTGNPAACLNAKQLNYDPTRGADGSLTFKVDAQGDGYGLEWGEQLTSGMRTDTAATPGAVQDDGGATGYGAQAYLHATALAGADATVAVQHSADSVSWSSLLSFAQVTSAPQAQRAAVTGTVNRFVRASTTTSGGFSSFSFQVSLVRNQTAVSF